MRGSPALQLKVVRARLARRIRGLLASSRTTYVDERVAEYRRYWSEAAAMIGASFEELSPSVWEVRRGSERTRLANYVTQCDDPITLHLAGDKPFCHRLAKAAGAPVPDHVVIDLTTLGEARRFLESADVPVVVKPASGSSSGLGVSTYVQSPKQLAAAVALASLFDQRILVERMVPGESYRLLYLEGRLIHAVRRRGIRVIGDGRPLSELLEANGHGWLTADSLTRQTLAAQRVALDSPTRPGADILVRGLPKKSKTQELRTVYDESVLGQCSAELVCAGAAVVRALGSEFAGVDVITPDPSVSLRAAGGAVIEINTTPGIHHHYIDQASSRSTPVAVPVLEHLLTRKVGC